MAGTYNFDGYTSAADQLVTTQSGISRWQAGSFPAAFGHSAPAKSPCVVGAVREVPSVRPRLGTRRHYRCFDREGQSLHKAGERSTRLNQLKPGARLTDLQTTSAHFIFSPG